METRDKKAVLRERAVHNYIRALDEENSVAVEQILKLAETDTMLAEMLTQIDHAYAEEMGITISLDEANLVRLLHKHLSNYVHGVDSSESLTIGEVVAHLKAKRLISSSDQTIADILAKNSRQLPQNLSLAEVKRLSLELGVHASDTFWRDFRKTAITLSMGQDPENQEMLAAARERKSQKTKREAKDE